MAWISCKIRVARLILARSDVRQGYAAGLGAKGPTAALSDCHLDMLPSNLDNAGDAAPVLAPDGADRGDLRVEAGEGTAIA